MINTATLKLNTVIRRTKSVPFSVILLIAIVLLFVSYIWQTNGVATSIYQLDSMEEERSSALLYRERLNLQLIESRSTSILSAAAIDLGLQQPDAVHYLSPTSLDVAILLP